MLQQLNGRLTSVTRRVVGALTMAFLFLSSSVVQAQQQQPEPARLPCGILCWIIIIIIIIVIIIIIFRFIKGRK
jgi:NADH:ubiquinone oxidoreductase subunit 6 (subunit J)